MGRRIKKDNRADVLEILGYLWSLCHSDEPLQVTQCLAALTLVQNLTLGPKSKRILWSVLLVEAKGVDQSMKIIVEPWQWIWFGWIKVQLRLERNVLNTCGEFGWMKGLCRIQQSLGKCLHRVYWHKVSLEFLSP